MLLRYMHLTEPELVCGKTQANFFDISPVAGTVAPIAIDLSRRDSMVNPSARRDAELKKMLKSNVCKGVLAMTKWIIATCAWIMLLLVVHNLRADPDFSSVLLILTIMEVCLGICCAIDVLFLVIRSASVIGNLYCLYLVRIGSQDKVMEWFQNTTILASLLTLGQSEQRILTIAQDQHQDQDQV